ncbi:MAG: hypothetical protein M3O50_04365 [Myxococcota bacterium]|nr:hypothetical protein [Myxococcota bacterium]
MQTLPAPLHTVLELFETSLAGVRFPDVDAQTLGRLAAEVEAAAEAVAVAQAALDTARRALLERQDALYQQAQRGLAYARVYAENDEALSARLDAIALSRPSRRTKINDEALVLSAEPPPPRSSRSNARRRTNGPVIEPLLAQATTGELSAR